MIFRDIWYTSRNLQTRTYDTSADNFRPIWVIDSLTSIIYIRQPIIFDRFEWSILLQISYIYTSADNFRPSWVIDTLTNIIYIRQPIIFDRFEWLILLHYIYSRYFWTDLSGLSYSKLRKPRENVGRACSAYIFHVILLYLGIYHIFPPIFIRVITFTFQVKTDQLGGGYCNPSRLLNKPSHVCRRAAIEKLSYSWNSQLSVGRSVGRSIVSQSVRRSVGRSMGWSVGRSVGRSVASAVSKGIRIFWSLVN